MITSFGQIFKFGRDRAVRTSAAIECEHREHAGNLASERMRVSRGSPHLPHQIGY